MVMKIWLVRHGQTNLNIDHRMQGLTDEPLNETGLSQAREARKRISDVTFDAVYASPLDRAIVTASIVGNVPREKVIIDERIIEVNFGKYEKMRFRSMGVPMMLYWSCPEVFWKPKSVEPISSMIRRSHGFLKELEKKEYENVLVASHGGILRAMNGYLCDRGNGLVWRPKMQNCEIRVYESENGKHTFAGQY